MREKNTDEMMINHILCSLPDEYESKVEHLRDIIDDEKSLTLYQVIEALRANFDSISKRKGDKIDLEVDETPTLYTRPKSFQGFKGTCFNCG